MLILQITAGTHQIFTKELAVYMWGTRWSSWLRYCGFDSRGGSLGIFHLFKISDLSVAVGSTQPLPQMRTRSISWWVKAAGA